MSFRAIDKLLLTLELFVTHFVVDEWDSLAVCRATATFWVENILPPLANAFSTLTTDYVIILALVVHHKDLHGAISPRSL
jgi:hypothetical protein